MSRSLEDDLLELRDKYTELIALREPREEREAAGEGRFPEEEELERKNAFRALARRFPGALRELDTSTAARLRDKLAQLDEEIAAARADPSRTVPSRPWVAVVWDFHRALREALAVKLWLARRLPRGGVVTDEMLAEFRAWHARYPHATGLLGTVDRRYLERHLSPPDGRILSLVWGMLSERHGLDRDAVVAAIFG